MHKAKSGSGQQFWELRGFVSLEVMGSELKGVRSRQ